MKRIRFFLIVAACHLVILTPPGIRLGLVPLSIESAVPEQEPGQVFILGGGYNHDQVMGISTEERIKGAFPVLEKCSKIIHLIDYIRIKDEYYKKKTYELLGPLLVCNKIEFHLKSDSTIDNCRVIASVMKECENGVAITSPYHVLRTRMILSMMDVSNVAVQGAEDSEVYSTPDIEQWRRNLTLVFREYPALIRDFFTLAFKNGS